MKKVLLSLTSLLFIFNVSFVNAEEIEVLNNEDNESTEVLESNDNEVIENDEAILNNENEVTDVKTYVAELNGVNYETLDEAISIAKDSDTITLLSDTDITVGSINKVVTIKGNGFKLNVPRQEKQEGGYLAIYGTLNLYNTKIYFVREAKANEWSLYVSPNSSFNLYNSECVFENMGIYADGEAKINLDNSKMTLTNMKYTSMMSDNISKLNIKNGSVFTISKPMDINGMTGFDVLVDNSKLNIEDCASQGMVYGSLTLTNNAVARFVNCSTGINLYRNQAVTVEGNSELIITKSAERAIMSQAGYTGLIVRKGSKLSVTECGYGWKKTDDETKHYASKGAITMGVYGWYESKGEVRIYRQKAEINFEDGAIVNITNNSVRGITFSGNKAYIGNTTTITNNGGESVAVGGGIYNIYGTITINEGAKIYNNHANTSSDDIYNSGENATIELINTNKDWILDDCNDNIDNWYDDSKDNRWNAHGKTEEEVHVEEVNSKKYNEELTIKAAHNIYSNVIARYVDKDGKEISEEVITNGKYRSEYQTNEKEIQYYELIEVKGETKGTYGLNDIVVTYIYEYVGGTGGDDPEFPRTGIESNSLIEIMTVVSFIALGTTVILKKKLM